MPSAPKQSTPAAIPDNVVLVNERDEALGTMEKLEAHRRGLLHRAFSVFVFDSRGYLILQRRAAGKYHSPGLWTNTCCSHPRPGESVADAARRRLAEEMGMACDLAPAFTFVYRSAFENGLIEHEFDHVLFGTSDRQPDPDPAEADAWRAVSLPDLAREIAATPEDFTVWLRACLPRVIEKRDVP